LSLATALTFAFGGCAVIGGIFKAGIWVGVLVVIAVLAGVVMLASRAR
jgi:hypothetical protein